MTIINSYVNVNGSPAPADSYPLLSRVIDDSNNEIGTVSGYHTDANNQKYAVVCLDAQYRLDTGAAWMTNAVNIPGSAIVTELPVYNSSSATRYFTAKETATFNCTKILDFCDSNAAYNVTSPAVSHCRSKSFIIDGVTYLGQLPTIVELSDILIHMDDINSLDSTASSYPSSVLPLNHKNLWSSTQYAEFQAYKIDYGGLPYYDGTAGSYLMVVPVLEIPIN